MGLVDYTVQSDGSITGAPTSTELQAVQQYPQVKWFLTVQALGSKFKALMDNTNGAQDKFISEIQRLSRISVVRRDRLRLRAGQ